MTTCPACTASGQSGFTLIEIMGAFVIFALGVLMAIQLSGALGRQIQYAAVSSELVTLAREPLDSLARMPGDSVDVGTTGDTLNVQGLSYARTLTISLYNPMLLEATVLLQPVGGTGPRYRTDTYLSKAWE